MFAASVRLDLIKNAIDFDTGVTINLMTFVERFTCITYASYVYKRDIAPGLIRGYVSNNITVKCIIIN